MQQNRLRRLLVLAAACASFATSASRIFAADAPAAPAPAAPANTTTAAPANAAHADPKADPKAGRTQEAIMADLNTTSGELRQVLSSPKFLTDAKLRAELAPKAIPALNKMLGLFDELAVVDTNFAGQAKQVKGQFYTLAALFGDEKAEATLKTQSQSKDEAQAGIAKGALFMVAWGKAGEDAAAQTKVVDELETAAKAKPADDALADIATQMSQQAPATPAIKARLSTMLTTVFTGPKAKQVAEELGAEAKLKSVEGKPLVLAGPLNDGKAFTSADWKGKVILVDFWATWCGPCRAELPRVKKIYASYHEKGLEVLGVSCDRDAAALKTFLEENKDMPWPQLFNTAKPGWHELATGFGIQGIPTMFLIDKKGIVRTVEARESFEELIPKMLDEK